jgi:hypothetical protein
MLNQIKYRDIHHEISVLLFVEKDCSLENYNRDKERRATYIISRQQHNKELAAISNQVTIK